MRTLNSKEFIFMGAVSIVLVILFFGDEAYSQKKPNIILMSIDTLRADHLSCYGYSRKTSPNIDKFSKDAVLFENAISQAPTTAPAHMSLFTATTPAVHGVCNFNEDGGYDKSLSKNIPTFAEVLSKKNI